MRILVVNQFFWPDLAPTGQYLCDLTRHLAARGHQVTVICSGGSYAESGGEDLSDPPPVEIIRVPGSAYKRGALARLSSYSRFFSGALWHALRVPKPDLILTMTTPPLLSVAGAIVKALRGPRHFIWEMDVFPDALVTIGALPERSVITRMLGWISDATRRHADGLIALGPCMKTRLVNHGTPAERIHIAENWADGRNISAGPERESGPLNVLYSGNLGVTHDVDTIAGAIRHFAADPRFVFTFAGGGVGRKELEALCKAENIPNVRFLPYAERGQISEHLAQADIGLVTEKTSCVGTVVPSKVYGLLAAGRPLLFIGPRDATPALLIEQFQCGWQVNPGDQPALITLLDKLAECRAAVWVPGRRARTTFESHYDLPNGVARVAAILGVDSVPSAPLWKTASRPLEVQLP